MNRKTTKNIKIFLLLVIIPLLSALVVAFFNQNSSVENPMLPVVQATTYEEPKETTNFISIKQPSNAYSIPLPLHVFQTFNNCGPATLSMVLSNLGVERPQEELGKIIRPYQNPQGNNDDKSVTLDELAEEAEKDGFVSYYRPNGTIELIKLFVSNDIPVVTRTWLKKGEDIGHYRIVKGYDEGKKQIIQDDSFQGPNLSFSYEEFLNIWQPFSYEYLVIVPKEKEELVQAILKEESEVSIAWQNSLNRSLSEEKLNPQNLYPIFNQAVALYHLGKYQDSIDVFETIQNNLSPRMLWYQIQPILSYSKLGIIDKVIFLTDTILANGNKAFSELYLARGEAYLQNGALDLAKQEFESAVFYNSNFEPARLALEKLKE